MSNSIIPNSFQCPNLYVDGLLALLSDAEVRVLFYMSRRIFGFNESRRTRSGEIRLADLVNGFELDGDVKDNGAGVSKSTASRALSSLVSFGIARLARPGRGSTPALYELELDGDQIDWDALLERASASAEKRAVYAQRLRDRKPGVSRERDASDRAADNGGLAGRPRVGLPARPRVGLAGRPSEGTYKDKKQRQETKTRNKDDNVRALETGLSSVSGTLRDKLVADLIAKGYSQDDAEAGIIQAQRNEAGGTKVNNWAKYVAGIIETWYAESKIPRTDADLSAYQASYPDGETVSPSQE